MSEISPSPRPMRPSAPRSEEHTSELQSQSNLVCRLLLEKKKNKVTRYKYGTNNIPHLERLQVYVTQVLQPAAHRLRAAACQARRLVSRAHASAPSCPHT